MLRSRLSLEEFLALPDDPALEWVKGEVVRRPVPTELHAVLAAILATCLLNWARQTKAGRVMVEARSTVRDENDGRSIIPDVSFVSRTRISGPARHRHLEKAPDLAVEIMSPGQGFGSVQERVNWLLSHGSRLVWIVDAEDRTVTIFRSGQLPQVLDTTSILEDGDLLPGFSLSIRELFDEAEASSEVEQPT